jgi:TRAP-type mannitol/chloroaromatic compound transport system permease small subunit
MRVIAFIGKLSLWSGRLGALVVLPLVFAMVFEVISRYVFSSPTMWAFELSYMMMGAIFLLGLSYALLVGQHVNVDFIHQRLPPRAIALIDAIGYAVLTSMLTWMLVTLAQNAIDVYRSGEASGLSAWNPKIWPYRVIYVVGFALFALQSFAKLLENLLVVLGHAPKVTRS